MIYIMNPYVHSCIVCIFGVETLGPPNLPASIYLSDNAFLPSFVSFILCVSYLLSLVYTHAAPATSELHRKLIKLESYALQNEHYCYGDQTESYGIYLGLLDDISYTLLIALVLVVLLFFTRQLLMDCHPCFVACLPFLDVATNDNRDSIGILGMMICLSPLTLCSP